MEREHDAALGVDALEHARRRRRRRDGREVVRLDDDRRRLRVEGPSFEATNVGVEFRGASEAEL